ncbi:hypothetical protein B0H14DRAFT_2576948 [Mycena olivaceomarginata]|nr:hypothetical protein B0H14DRAFT_2576948 [Mycena olivaceomarginata]
MVPLRTASEIPPPPQVPHRYRIRTAASPHRAASLPATISVIFPTSPLPSPLTTATCCLKKINQDQRPFPFHWILLLHQRRSPLRCPYTVCLRNRSEIWVPHRTTRFGCGDAVLMRLEAGELGCPAGFAIALRTLGARMTVSEEWNFDAPDIGGATDYDISNIQGYSVPQQIIPDSGTVLTCTSATCPCNEAYRPGDTSGTCGGTGPKDQATRVSGSSGFLTNSTINRPSCTARDRGSYPFKFLRV